MCKLFNLFRKKQEVEIEEVSVKLTPDELSLINKVNFYRKANGLDFLVANNDLKDLAEERVNFWKSNGYNNEDNLHDAFFGHRKQYLDNGFNKIAENVGITNRPFYAFKNSKEHDKAMLMDWKYISTSVKQYDDVLDYVCLILGK